MSETEVDIVYTYQQVLSDIISVKLSEKNLIKKRKGSTITSYIYTIYEWGLIYTNPHKNRFMCTK